MGIVVKVEVGGGSLQRLLAKARSCKGKEGILTVSLACHWARTHVAIWTIHATMYANWYGMTVETRNRRMAQLMILRLGVGGENIGRFLSKKS